MVLTMPFLPTILMWEAVRSQQALLVSLPALRGLEIS